MANYPTSASTNANLYIAVNNLRTSLNGAINNSVTTVTVASTTGFPTAGFISIENEIIAYTGTNATQFTGCTRGADGTTAASHADLILVNHRVIAAHHNVLKDETIAVETDLIAAKGALNDVDTPASTATDVKDRLDQIVSEIKRITQNTNWYDTVAAGLQDIAGNTYVGVGRNRIINGDMQIDQANAGSTVTVNTASVFYSVDQFWGTGIAAAGVYTLLRDTTSPPTGFERFIRATCTTADASLAAGDRYYITNNLEGYNVRDLLWGSANAKTVTLSFWVRSSLTGTYSGAFRNSANNRSYAWEYTINAANTWEKKTITVAGDQSGTWVIDNGIGIRISWALALGSDYDIAPGAWGSTADAIGSTNQVNFMSSSTTRTWDIAGVQFEVGSVATPFEYVPWRINLANCQRYYEISYSYDTKPGTATASGSHAGPGAITNTSTVRYGPVYYKVSKRATPTVSIWNEAGTADTITTTSPSDVNTARAAIVVTTNQNSHGFRQAVTSTDLHCGAAHWAADARL